jgi:hypothetical protein
VPCVFAASERFCRRWHYLSIKLLYFTLPFQTALCLFSTALLAKGGQKNSTKKGEHKAPLKDQYYCYYYAINSKSDTAKASPIDARVVILLKVAIVAVLLRAAAPPISASKYIRT